MRENKEDLIFKYWKGFIQNPSKPVKDWLKKENEYLKKNIRKDSIVLDIGIGFGRNIESIVNNVKKFIGIDKSKLMLNFLKDFSKKYPNVEFFNEDAKKMHFEDNSFDYVICMGNTFGDFASEKVIILKEMKRVCKKGGKILISIYSEKALDVRIKEYMRIGIKIKEIRDGEIITEDGLKLEQFTKEKLTKLFKKAGLKVKIINLNPISYICIAIK